MPIWLRRSVPTAALAAGLCAAVAWLVRPDNQLGTTRPTTIWGSIAIALALSSLIVGALSSRRDPVNASRGIIVAAAALLTAVGALTMLMTLPHGN